MNPEALDTEIDRRYIKWAAVVSFVVASFTFGIYLLMALGDYLRAETLEASVKRFLKYANDRSQFEPAPKDYTPSADECVMYSKNDHSLSDKWRRRRLGLPDVVPMPGDFDLERFNQARKARGERVAQMKERVESLTSKQPDGSFHMSQEARDALVNLNPGVWRFRDPRLGDYLFPNTDGKYRAVAVPILLGMFTFAALMFILAGCSHWPRMSSIVLPWTYPHAGWRRLAFVLAPLLCAAVFIALFNESDEPAAAFAGALMTLIITAPFLFLAREIALWIRRGFNERKDTSTPP